MAETVDDLTIEYIEDGVTTVKQLEKHVLTKGAWSTIIFSYQDWDKRKEVYGPRKFSIRRYQKKNNEYRLKSKFNISNDEQAKKLIEVLTKWIDS